MRVTDEILVRWFDQRDSYPNSIARSLDRYICRHFQVLPTRNGVNCLTSNRPSPCRPTIFDPSELRTDVTGKQQKQLDYIEDDISWDQLLENLEYLPADDDEPTISLLRIKRLWKKRLFTFWVLG
jgi:hypothetical protein